MSHNVPTSKLARSRIAGKAVMKVGVGELTHKVKRPFLSKRAQVEEKESLDERNAKTLFNALTQLRGTALKMAQILGMEQGLLPEAYIKELEKSFHQVPGLNRVLVRKVITRALSYPPEKLFSSFEAKAFAAASLGQVHRATLDNVDNQAMKVAVKVQYPGIDIAIKNDIALMRGIARGMSNTKLILHALQEIEARLMEEVDYCTEAKNTQWFQQHLQLTDINIPKVYPEFSSQHVLTTEFIEGLHLDAWLATQPSQTQRNQMAQKLYDLFYYSSQELKCLHADPNPGNYLFHQDGTITLIDFGCVRKMSDRFVSAYPRLVKAYFDDDPTTLFAIYEALGMSNKDFSESFYKKALRPFGQWLTLPYRTECFDFAKQVNYTQQGKQPMQKVHNHFKVDYVAEEFIFHNRTYYGLLQIFEKMGATVCFRSSVPL